MSGHEQLPADWHFVLLQSDPECGCTEEVFEVPEGVMTLHVGPDQTVLECWLGYSADEDDTFCVVRKPMPSRLAAYGALVANSADFWATEERALEGIPYYKWMQEKL